MFNVLCEKKWKAFQLFLSLLSKYLSFVLDNLLCPCTRLLGRLSFTFLFRQLWAVSWLSPWLALSLSYIFGKRWECVCMNGDDLLNSVYKRMLFGNFTMCSLRHWADIDLSGCWPCASVDRRLNCSAAISQIAGASFLLIVCHTVGRPATEGLDKIK